MEFAELPQPKFQFELVLVLKTALAVEGQGLRQGEILSVYVTNFM